jgi:hypothetical protein
MAGFGGWRHLPLLSPLANQIVLKAIPLLILSTWLLAAYAAHGQGTLVVDQQTEPVGFAEGPVVIQSYSSVGQSFTPGLNSIGYVALALADNTPGIGSATLYVNLRSGSVTGTILDSTTPVFMPADTGYVITDFYFPAAVSLTPGTTYYFDVNVQSGSQWLVYGSVPDYAGGSEFLNGVAQPLDSLWFQEGNVVPEPSATWLALAGGSIFLCFRHWQIKSC